MKGSLQFRCRRLLRLMMALEGRIDVLQAEFVTGIYDQLVAIVHKPTSSHPCFARLFTSTLELIILRRAAGLHLSVDQNSLSPIFLQYENQKMRAEAESLVQSIKQSMG